MRRMPPSDVEDNLDRLIQLRPNIEDELLQRVDLPLKVQKDPSNGKNFIQCDYNRDGDSFRSPWSNEYYPAMDDGFKPKKKLQKLELQANELFNVYRHLYFEGGYSSVYMWELENPDDFAACFLIKKDVNASDPKFQGMTGTWNSIHVFSVTGGFQPTDPYTYKLTSTVIVSMVINQEGLGNIDLSGSVSAQKTNNATISGPESHLATMGSMIEEMEISLRSQVEGIYIQKTKEIVNGIRVNDPYKNSANKKMAQSFAQAASMRVRKEQ